jgi:ubiquinone/menaquinone biosynthesis C-methylase UbiE
MVLAADRQVTPLKCKLTSREEIRNILKATPGRAILDLGCGEGKLIALIGSREKTYVGLDLSRKRLVRATRRSIPGEAHLVLGDMTRIPFKENSFDAVLSSFVLHEMSRRQVNNVLADVFRVLRTRGRMMILDYAIPEGFKRYLFYVYFAFNESLKLGFLKYNLKKLTSKVGFSICDVRRAGIRELIVAEKPS